MLALRKVAFWGLAFHLSLIFGPFSAANEWSDAELIGDDGQFPSKRSPSSHASSSTPNYLIKRAHEDDPQQSPRQQRPEIQRPHSPHVSALRPGESPPRQAHEESNEAQSAGDVGSTLSRTESLTTKRRRLERPFLQAPPGPVEPTPPGQKAEPPQHAGALRGEGQSVHPSSPRSALSDPEHIRADLMQRQSPHMMSNQEVIKELNGLRSLNKKIGDSQSGLFSDPHAEIRILQSLVYVSKRGDDLAYHVHERHDFSRQDKAFAKALSQFLHAEVARCHWNWSLAAQRKNQEGREISNEHRSRWQALEKAQKALQDHSSRLVEGLSLVPGEGQSRQRDAKEEHRRLLENHATLYDRLHQHAPVYHRAQAEMHRYKDEDQSMVKMIDNMYPSPKVPRESHVSTPPLTMPTSTADLLLNARRVQNELAAITQNIQPGHKSVEAQQQRLAAMMHKTREYEEIMAQMAQRHDFSSHDLEEGNKRLREFRTQIQWQHREYGQAEARLHSRYDEAVRQAPQQQARFEQKQREWARWDAHFAAATRDPSKSEVQHAHDRELRKFTSLHFRLSRGTWQPPLTPTHSVQFSRANTYDLGAPGEHLRSMHQEHANHWLGLQSQREAVEHEKRTYGVGHKELTQLHFEHIDNAPGPDRLGQGTRSSHQPPPPGQQPTHQQPPPPGQQPPPAK